MKVISDKSLFRDGPKWTYAGRKVDQNVWIVDTSIIVLVPLTAAGVEKSLNLLGKGHTTVDLKRESVVGADINLFEFSAGIV